MLIHSCSYGLYHRGYGLYLVQSLHDSMSRRSERRQVLLEGYRGGWNHWVSQRARIGRLRQGIAHSKYVLHWAS